MPSRLLVGWGIALIVLLAYLPAIQGGAFHFDDTHHIVENRALRDPSNLYLLRYFVDVGLWSGEPGNAMYRPVGMLPHALDALVWGVPLSGPERLPAIGWVLTNALLHALVSVLVWRLALRLRLGEVAAALAGLVMALHPVHSEVVNYVSSRSESVAAVLVLAALLLHLSGRERTGTDRVLRIGAAALLAGLAVLAKETAALAFLAIGWLELVLSRRDARAWGVAISRAAPYLLVFGAVLLARWLALDAALPGVRLVRPAEGADIQRGGGRTLLQNLLTQSRVVVLYYQLLLRPVGLNVDHDVAVSTGMTRSVAAAIALHATIVGSAIAAWFRGRRLLPLCVGWFWLFLAPSITVPLNVVMNEHRLYLPGIAVALLAGAVLARVGTLLARSRGPAFALAAVGAPLLLFVPLVVQRSREWRDDLTLWSVAVERSPQSARAHMHHGAALFNRAKTLEGDARIALIDEALAEYQVADRLHPDWFDLHLNLGGAWDWRGRASGERADFERALAAYEKAGEIVGLDKARPRYLRSIVLTELGRYDEAIELIRTLDAEDDSVTTLYDNALAPTLRKKGDSAGALEAIDRVIAIEVEGNRIDGLLTAGWWCFEDGDLDRSQAYLTRALEIAREVGSRDRRQAIEKKLFRAHLYVGRFLNLMGQPDPSFEQGARKLGWIPSVEEMEWYQGGRTPGLSTALKKND